MTKEQLGCSRWASDQVPQTAPGQELLLSDEFAPLLEAINQMGRNLQEDPDMLATAQDWLDCMANAGYPEFGSSNYVGSIYGRQYLASSSIESARGQLSEEQRIGTEQAAALQEREIALALADLDCRVAVDYTERRNAIQLAAETQFVEDNRPALEAFRSASEQRGVAIS